MPTVSTLATELHINRSSVRHYARAYEAVTGQPLPRDPDHRNRRVLEVEVTAVIRRAHALMQQGQLSSRTAAIRLSLDRPAPTGATPAPDQHAWRCAEAEVFEAIAAVLRSATPAGQPAPPALEGMGVLLTRVGALLRGDAALPAKFSQHDPEEVLRGLVARALHHLNVVLHDLYTGGADDHLCGALADLRAATAALGRQCAPAAG